MVRLMTLCSYSVWHLIAYSLIAKQRKLSTVLKLHCALETNSINVHMNVNMHLTSVFCYWTKQHNTSAYNNSFTSISYRIYYTKVSVFTLFLIWVIFYINLQNVILMVMMLLMFCTHNANSLGLIISA